MAKRNPSKIEQPISHDRLAELLNEYQAMIAYVMYSQVLKGQNLRASQISSNLTPVKSI
jgi:hypothetical protein